MERKVAVLHALHQILKKNFSSHLYKGMIFNKNFANNFKREYETSVCTAIELRCVTHLYALFFIESG
jgi:hypothetical protein